MWPFKRANKFGVAAGWVRESSPEQLERMLRCGAFPPGALMGYPCTLRRKHPLPHEALISVTTTNGRETGRTTRTWPSKLGGSA